MAIHWASLLGSGVDLHLDVDIRSGRRDGLERALRDAIRVGRLAPDTRLPASRALAVELGIARNTVSAAYDQLIAEGYLTARQGAGTFVQGVAAALSPVAPAPPIATARYDLRPGRPDVTTFPIAAWLRAMKRALSAAPASAFGFDDPLGRIELRSELATYLGRARGVRVTPDRIMITSGYVQALALVVRALGPGVRIGMENPGLALHRDVVARHGGRVTPIAIDEHGARTDELTGTPHAVVLTPAHQYPTGVTLGPSRRQDAVRWARSHDRILVEDDYDGEFRFDRQPIGALQGMAPDHVVYIGTASKTLAPALRLAWAVLPPRLIEPMRTAKRLSDSYTETLGQLALAELIAVHDYDRHIRAGRLRYRRRRDLLVQRLGPLAERGRVTIGGVAAGLQALVGLGPGLAEAAVIDAAAEQGLLIDGLGPHWHDARPHPAGLLVGYGTPATSAYPAALDLLVRILRTG